MIVVLKACHVLKGWFWFVKDTLCVKGCCVKGCCVEGMVWWPDEAELR